MIEAVMLWNEPNNLSHWDRYQDPEWELFARMICLAGDMVNSGNAINEWHDYWFKPLETLNAAQSIPVIYARGNHDGPFAGRRFHSQRRTSMAARMKSKSNSGSSRLESPATRKWKNWCPIT